MPPPKINKNKQPAQNTRMGYYSATAEFQNKVVHIWESADGKKKLRCTSISNISYSPPIWKDVKCLGPVGRFLYNQKM